MAKKVKNITLDSTYKERSLFYEIKGKRITVGEYHVDFFQQLQMLPIEIKLRLMLLSDADVSRYIENRIASARKTLLWVCEQEWRDRATDELFDRDYKYDQMHNYTLNSLERKLKGRAPIKLHIIDDIIQFISGEKSEFYTKNQ